MRVFSADEIRTLAPPQRLVEALRRHRSLAPCELLSSIVDEVRRHSPHEQHDDITLIIAKCLPH